VQEALNLAPEEQSSLLHAARGVVRAHLERYLEPMEAR